MTTRPVFASLSMAGILLASVGAAADEAEPVIAPEILVTSTRVPRSAFDAPAALDRLDGEAMRSARLQVNLSESLAALPGVVARDRQNYAQDLQISIRGFGARSSFGLRGIRVYVDDIPATMPDGQGQISNIDLGSLDRVEVLRGPFSALYGNSSGGVISAFTADGAGSPRFSPSMANGADGTRRQALKLSGAMGNLGYVVDGSHFSTDGYREHARAARDLGNAKLTFDAGSAGVFRAIFNSVRLPEAQDPLGLTRAQFEADPRRATPEALVFDTRKSVTQSQGGLVWDYHLGAGDRLHAMVYDGHRSTEQYQAIPVTTQANPLHAGGVIALGRTYRGGDLRWTHADVIGGVAVTTILGTANDHLREDRRGYENFAGTRLGIKGALRRREENVVANADVYAQVSVQFSSAWSMEAGLRESRVRFRTEDRYVTASNPDDSGALRYRETLPVIGAAWAPSPSLRWYANVGRGFETPTFNELSYRPDGGSGLNFGLSPARSRNVEAGLKWRQSFPGEVAVALFEVSTDQEIVTVSNAGGRSAFQNAGRTRRRGIEMRQSRDFGHGWKMQSAATWIDARYRDAFLVCATTPCRQPDTRIPDGNRLPGIPRASVHGELIHAPAAGWRYGVEAQYVGRAYVDDRNSDAADAYAIANAHAGYTARINGWTLQTFARLDNLTDRRYAGSIIANESNGRFFEPARGRAWLIGLSATFVLR